MSAAEEITDNILETQFNDFDKETVYHAKNEIIDIIGCIIAGANAPGCPQLTETIKQWGGREDASILVHGGRVPAQNAALVNSVMARSFDFEVMQPYVDGISYPAHINATTVPTAVAMAEFRGAGGKELITALVLGNDIASRLIAAGDYSVASPWDCTGTVTAFGSAAIASRLGGLNRQQAKNALGIVFSQLGGTFQNIHDGTHCFKLCQGLASRAGIFSAELAASGFLGLKDPFFSEMGYFPVYSGKYFPEILTKQLGRKFFSEGVFKPYPSCRVVHSSIDCSLELVNQHNINPEDIQEIVLNLPLPLSRTHMAQPFKIGVVPQVDATFSIPYNIANVLVRKSVSLEHFTENSIRDPRVIALAAKVSVASAFNPEKRHGAEVTVKMKDGQAWSASVDVPKGDTVDSPLSEKEIDEKFKSNVAFSRTISARAAENALAMLKKLEEIDNIDGIIGLLVK